MGSAWNCGCDSTCTMQTKDRIRAILQCMSLSTPEAWGDTQGNCHTFTMHYPVRRASWHYQTFCNATHAQLWGMKVPLAQHHAVQGKLCRCDWRANFTCCRRLDSRSTRRSLFLAPPTPRPLGLTDALTDALRSSCTISKTHMLYCQASSFGFDAIVLPLCAI